MTRKKNTSLCVHKNGKIRKKKAPQKTGRSESFVAKSYNVVNYRHQGFIAKSSSR